MIKRLKLQEDITILKAYWPKNQASNYDSGDSKDFQIHYQKHDLYKKWITWTSL